MSERIISVVNSKIIQFICCLYLLSLSACAPSIPDESSPILLFNGTGTSPGSVKAIDSLLKKAQLKYATVNCSQLNRMVVQQLMAHRLFIVPGGNYITIGNGLTDSAMTNVNAAVQGGMNYLGICAGGLIAGNPRPRGLNLTSGVRFDFYKMVNQGIHKTPVTITGPDTGSIEHYWEDGPHFKGWGEVIAKYPDDTPAVAQASYGKGWVILCGVHPEAPDSWRQGMKFKTSSSEANSFAQKLIDAALNGTRLPHY